MTDKRKNPYPSIPSICLCGCNEIVYGSRKYVSGHNAKTEHPMKGRRHTQISKERISRTLRKEGIKPPSRSGCPAWCKGLTKETDKRLMVAGKKISVTLTGRKQPMEVVEKRLKSMVGRYRGWKPTIELRQLWSQQRKGKQTGKDNPFYGNHHSEETKKILSDSKIGMIWVSGSDHPNWKGGISKLPYCEKWTRKLKESVRKRDSYICQLCSIIYQSDQKLFSVHHIHYDKENCYPDLITLCSSCSSKVNFSREYYEHLFMNKLNDRELLFWTRRGII